MKKFVKTLAVVMSCILMTGTATVYATTDGNATKYVYLGGDPFGVKFYNDGVVIIELEEFYANGHYVCPAKDGGIKVGDIIKAVDSKEVKTNEELQQAMLQCGGKPIHFTVIRNGKTLNKTVVPCKNMAGAYLLGAWVRDSCAGIGTVTYYDADNDYFAALGHGICDNDTAALLPLGSAEVVRAEISSVTRSSAGKAGSLNGYFTDESLGCLTKNTLCGVYGTANDKNMQNKTKVEVADNDEIRLGGAEVYTTIESDCTKAYSIEITKFCDLSEESNENFVIKITDKELLEKCGGIVQGMSGSPIIQDGKLVGAITHVFLNNTDEGYGITAQNMVSNGEE